MFIYNVYKKYIIIQLKYYVQVVLYFYWWSLTLVSNKIMINGALKHTYSIKNKNVKNNN